MANFSVPVGTTMYRFPLADPSVDYNWLPEDLTGTNTLQVDGALASLWIDNWMNDYFDTTVHAWRVVPSSANWAVTVTGSIGTTDPLPTEYDLESIVSGAWAPAGWFFNGEANQANLLVVATGATVNGISNAFSMSANTRVENSGTIASNGFALVYDDLRGATPPPPVEGYIHPVTTNLGFGTQIVISNQEDGTIFGGYSAILNGSFSTLRLINQGTIEAVNIADFFGPIETTSPYSINTSGAISSMGRLQITNSGTIDGGIKSAWHSNSITNSGTIDGSIYCVVLTAGSGRVDTNADGDFTDTGDRLAAQLVGTSITNSGRIIGFDVTTDLGTTQIAIVTGGARDTVVNSGHVNGETVGGIFGLIDLGGGADRLDNTGTILGDVFMGDGSDTVANAEGAQIIGGVYLGNGNDTISNDGYLGAASEEIMLEPTLIVFADDGNDVLINGAAGQIGEAGVADPDFVLTNPLQFVISVSYDTYFNPGTLVDMGAGHDSVSNAGVIWGVVDMGLGNDTFTGGANFDLVSDADGRDSYDLGAGADVFYMRGEDFDADTIAGGAGIDLVYLQDYAHESGDTSGSFIDLTRGITRSNEAGARLDLISGFEQVVGTYGNDQIYGGSGSETLVGGAGNDTIAGRGGRDVLAGGDGDDTFIFYSSADSFRTAARRDVILGFGVDAGDVLALSFDTDSTAAGTQTLTLDLADLLAAGTTFTGAGSFRTRDIGFSAEPIFAGAESRVFELDINGDGIADFGIELAYIPLA